MTAASDNDKKAKKTGRLAAALRKNLRRRKAQERQRSAPPASGLGTKTPSAPQNDKDS
jgi:hypothetical protein